MRPLGLPLVLLLLVGCNADETRLSGFGAESSAPPRVESASPGPVLASEDDPVPQPAPSTQAEVRPDAVAPAPVEQEDAASTKDVPRTEPRDASAPSAVAATTPPKSPWVLDLKMERRAKVANGDDSLTFKISRFQKARRWVFDRAGGMYSYRDAAKRHKMLVVDFTITTEKNSATLPDIRFFRAESGTTLNGWFSRGIEMYRWSNYGSYLGNYADSANDFTLHDTIKFSTAAEVSNETLKADTLILAVGRVGCMNWRYDRWRTPPTWLERSSSCTDTYTYTTAEDFLRDWTPVKIVNARALKRRLKSAKQGPP